MINHLGKAISIAISAALVVGVAGCGSSSSASSKQSGSDGPITLKFAWWGSQERHNRTLKMIDLFEKQYPNITVKTEYAGFGDYWTKMATEAAGQNLPDVFQMDYSYIGEYTARKLIAPLDTYISSGQLNLKDVDTAYLSGGKLGNQYAIPLGINAPAIAYDPAIFEKAGVPIPQPGYTVDDLIKTSRELKAKISDKDFYPIGSGAFDFPYYLREKGASYYNKDGTALGFTNGQYLVDYINYWSSLEKEGLEVPSQVAKTIQGDQESLIVKGKAALSGTTSNLIVALSTYANRPLKLLPPPTLPGGREGNYLKPACLISVASTSKNKDAAVKFIDFMTNNLDANDILGAERGVPISQKVRDHLYPALSEGDKEQFKYIEYVQKHSSAIDPPIPKSGRQVSDLLNNLQEQISYNQITPDNAAKQFLTQANDILSSNKQ